MDMYEFFELQRQSDDLVYQFDRRVTGNGEIAYQRRDQDLWITYRSPDLGWVAYDEESAQIRGRPWEVLPKDQDPDHPPEGEWVSKKNEKSYVYILKYATKGI
jgi:hypothetical protein